MKFFVSLLATLAFMLLLLDFYFIYLSKKNVTRKSFLASNIESNKVIIDSGSNGLFGINSSIIEAKLKMPVINLSDMAGVPLSHKISRIHSIAQDGDIVILPLEYHYYFCEAIDQNYVLEYFSKYSHYYKYLSFNDKYTLFKNLNIGNFFSFLLENLFESFLFSKSNINISYDSFYYLLDSKAMSLHGDFLNRPGMKELSGEQNETIFISNTLNSLVLDSFSDNIHNLLSLKDQGVDLYLTWPAVTSFHVNNFQKNLGFIINLETELRNLGFKILGSPTDFVFDRSIYGYDTPYHLNIDGANARTKKLADLLGNWVPTSSSYNSVFKQINSKLNYSRNNNFNIKEVFQNINIHTYHFEECINKSFCDLKLSCSISPIDSDYNYLILSNPNGPSVSSDDLQSITLVSDHILYHSTKNTNEINRLNFHLVNVSGFDSIYDINPKVLKTSLSLEQVKNVVDLYTIYLNRAPDLSGLTHHLNAYGNHYDFERLKGNFLIGAGKELNTD